jgi:cellulose synthase/poly-beta-1,6-N-acetylglucosamine synthase-like glycosyltransferase
MYFALLVLAWLLAVFWMARASEVALNLDSVPDIASEPLLSEAMRAALPTLTVIVPAKNEGENIRATLASLVASDYPRLNVIAVDDRSSDATGEVMESFASQDARVGVIHVQELPDGWMGKPHAMHLGAKRAKADWLLFTDGDVLFVPDLLSRAVTHAELVGADHFVIVPTLVMKTVGERSMIGFMQVLAGLGSRLWRVADPKAKRDIVGIGAFNMIRRDVYKRSADSRQRQWRSSRTCGWLSALSKPAMRSASQLRGGWCNCIGRPAASGWPETSPRICSQRSRFAGGWQRWPVCGYCWFTRARSRA